jgi:tetratricopeptide (TPR) repeat protein
MRALLVAGVLMFASANARAECSCVAVAGDVAATIQAEVAKADGLYARGDFKAALDIYVRAYASSKDAALLYAQGMASWQLGMKDKAKASFEAYLAAGGSLLYKDRVEANLRGLASGAAAGGVGLVGRVGGAVGGVGGAVGGLGVGAVGAAATGVEGGVGMVGGVATDLKPKKPGRKVGIVLGVVAIAAIGAVGIHSIAAGVSSDIELDPKFDLGLGISGVAVGISAIYVAGITTAVAAAPACTVGLPTGKPLVAPIAMPGGGGLAAAMSF